jgi:3-dehydroquinate synthase
MSRISDEPVILVAECDLEGMWHASLFADDPLDPRLIRTGVRLPLAPSDVGPTPQRAVLRAIRHSAIGPISAIAFLNGSSRGNADSRVRLLSPHPVPVFSIPGWMAVAHSVPDDVRQFALLDVDAPLRFEVFRRGRRGITHALRPGPLGMDELLRPGGLIAPRLNGRIEDLLLAQPEFESLARESGPGLAGRRVLAATLAARPRAVVTALARILHPLMMGLGWIATLTELDLLVCTGALFEVLTPECRDSVSSELRRSDHLALMPVSYAINPPTRHAGALRCVLRELRRLGVRAVRGPETLRMYVSTSRGVCYGVTHPKRHVFDPEDETLAGVIGDRPVLAVVDRRVHGLYGQRMRSYFDSHLDCRGIVLVDGVERRKSWDQVLEVCSAAFSAHLPRQGVLLGVGGGVTLDLAGFAASIYRRGIPYVRIPTTLVGIVDVAMGIKQAINAAGHKNALGAFHPAMANINDVRFLATLPAREIACGLAEIVKMAVVRDPVLFDLVEGHAPELMDSRFAEPARGVWEILARAEESMLAELHPNLFEGDLRRLVDFGHSFSPQLEVHSEYRLAHGEAVALDILLSTSIAVERQLCPLAVLLRIRELFRRLGLPVDQVVAGVPELRRALDAARDHRGGALNLVVPTRMGAATFLQDVSDLELESALHTLHAGAAALQRGHHTAMPTTLKERV